MHGFWTLVLSRPYRPRAPIPNPAIAVSADRHSALPQRQQQRLKSELLERLGIAQLPAPPGSEDCCMSGCSICVWDVYAQEFDEVITRLSRHSAAAASPDEKLEIHRFIEESRAESMDPPEAVTEANTLDTKHSIELLREVKGFVDFSRSDRVDMLSKDKETVVVFVLGGPGAGKGTQCAKITSEFGFTHLSAGDLLRAEQANEASEHGELIRNYIKEGKIVPHEITIALLKNAIIASPNLKFLVDGFPRAMDQALAFEKTVCPGAFILYFECTEEEMTKRLLKRGETSGRTDDNMESIKKRFHTFRETSFPVIKHYESLGKVKKVVCDRGVDEVYAETRKYFT
ncbi:MAG: hypothetical protein SGCHY_004534 [Lobulomycetales sp.]